MDVFGTEASERKFKQQLTAKSKRSLGLGPWEGMTWSYPTRPTDVQEEERRKYFHRGRGVMDGPAMHQCQCVVHVAAQQSPECLYGLPDTAGQIIKDKMCYNPSTVCTRSPSSTPNLKKCMGAMNFEQVPDNELVAFAALFEIPMAWPYNRRTMIERMKKAQIKIGGKYMPHEAKDVLGGEDTLHEPGSAWAMKYGRQRFKQEPQMPASSSSSQEMPPGQVSKLILSLPSPPVPPTVVVKAEP